MFPKMGKSSLFTSTRTILPYTKIFFRNVTLARSFSLASSVVSQSSDPYPYSNPPTVRTSNAKLKPPKIRRYVIPPNPKTYPPESHPNDAFSTLHATCRTRLTEEELSDLRKEGGISAVIYNHRAQREIINITLNRKEFEFQLKRRSFMNRVCRIRLQDVRKEFYCLPRDISYNPVTLHAENIQFSFFEPYKTTRVKIPVVISGKEECTGLQKGGKLVTVTERVSCFWTGDERIPVNFEMNVSDADIGTVVRLSDLHFPQGLRPEKKWNHVIFYITGKRRLLQGVKAEGPIAATPAAGTPGASGDKKAATTTATATATGTGDKKAAASPATTSPAKDAAGAKTQDKKKK